MATSLVLTVIGPDKPGLVESLADTIARHDASWLESRMAHLAGQFAGLLRVSVSDDRADALTRALAKLETAGLRILVQVSAAATPTTAPRLLRLELVGQDRPGIIREIAGALATRGVNVEELETHCSSAPMSGETLFHARAALRLPDENQIDELRTTLEQIADELMVDVSLDSDEH